MTPDVRTWSSPHACRGCGQAGAIVQVYGQPGRWCLACAARLAPPVTVIPLGEGE